MARFPRYSLRTLFLIVTAAALAILPAIRWYREYRRQQEEAEVWKAFEKWKPPGGGRAVLINEDFKGE